MGFLTLEIKSGNQVYFGVTRFSIYLPSSSSWVLSSKDSDYLNKLYSDERLNPRFDIFLNYALPIYESYCKNFTYVHIVLFSEAMPEKWKNLLLSASERYSFIKLCKVKDQVYFQDVMEDFLKKNRKDDCPVALFRVDDDDILSEDFLEQLSQYTQFPFEGMSVSLCSAIAAKYDKGKFVDFRKVRAPLLSMGLANIGRFSCSDGKLHLPRAVNHMETDLHRPVIIDSRKPAFIWTHHKNQDSNHGVNGSGNLSAIEEAFLGYKTIFEPNYLKNFSSLQKDFSCFLNNVTEVFSAQPKEKVNEFRVDGVVSFEPANYRITYDIELYENKVSDSKSLIFFLGEHSAKIEKIFGLTKSLSVALSWYRYINSVAGTATGTFDIKVDQAFDTSTIGIKGWSVKSAINIKTLKIEKLA